MMNRWSVGAIALLLLLFVVGCEPPGGSGGSSSGGPLKIQVGIQPNANGQYEIGGSGPVPGSSSTPTVAPYFNDQFPQAVPLTIRGTGGTVYYTVDGSDPTAGTSVNRIAFSATTGISLANSCTLKAGYDGQASSVVSQDFEIYRIYYYVSCGWYDKDQDGKKSLTGTSGSFDPNFVLGYYQSEPDRTACGNDLVDANDRVVDASGSVVSGGSKPNGYDPVTGKWWGIQTNWHQNLDGESVGDAFQAGWFDDAKGVGQTGTQGAYLKYQFELPDGLNDAYHKILLTYGIRCPWDNTSPRSMNFYTSTDATSATKDSTATNWLGHLDTNNTYQVQSTVIDGTQLSGTHDLQFYAKCNRLKSSTQYDWAVLSSIRVSVRQ